MNFLNLIRYKNLLFIAIIQILIYYAVINPTLNIFGLHSLLSNWTILSLCIGTLCIAAGGYVINDYFDIKIDRINHPERLIVSNSISKKTAMKIYQTLTVIGVLCGMMASSLLKSMTIGLIFIIVPGMLWFYSASYKRQLIVGNIIVALLAALVPLLPLIAEAGALHAEYNELIKETQILYTLYSYVCGFALFAFLLTLAREIIKDLEDEQGDREMECHTIAIVWGNFVAKIVASVIFIIVNILLAYAVFVLIPNNYEITKHYFIYGILIPSICTIILLWSKQCTAYKNASNLTKFIMLIGILYSIIYYYILAKTYQIPFMGIFQII